MSRITDVERAHALALNLHAQRGVRASLADLDTERGGLFARQLRLLAELARLSADKPAHAVLEVAGTLGVGQGRATTLLDHGRRTVELYPRALELLEAGALRQATVELLLYVTAKHSEAVQAELGARVIDELIDCDAVDARALIVATLLEVEADLDADGQKERHAQARANRGVWVKQVEDGMARIGAEVDQIAARRFALDLDELCRAQGRADDTAGVERTVEQRRADVLAELPSRHLALLTAFQQGRSAEQLLGHPPGEDLVADLLGLPVRNPCTLFVHVPMTTLLDLDNRAGWVEGIGPVSAHQTRLLRPTASLQAVWVDADTGVPLGIDPKRVAPAGEPDWTDRTQVTAAAEQVRVNLRSMLRPVAVTDQVEAGRFASAALARLVKVRDVRCTGVGCPQPASRCEIDHLTAISDGGRTALWELALKSPRCHHARHDGWHSERHDLDGSTTWHSPAGGQYRRRSAWRPPPSIRRGLPPPVLDRPDGGKARTFGADAELHTDVELGLPPEADTGLLSRRVLSGGRGTSRGPALEGRSDHPPVDVGRPDPWPTEDPPPF
jgi:hypothetical protein